MKDEPRRPGMNAEHPIEARTPDAGQLDEARAVSDA